MRVSWWKKLILKLEISIVESVPDWLSKKTGEHIMALHFCKYCKDYQYAILFNPMSLLERIECSECANRQKIKDVCGWSLFRFSTCAQTAQKAGEQMKGRKAKFKNIIVFFLFLRFFFCGLGKYAPIDRQGRTISDLEEATTNYFLAAFILLAESGKI